jgi:hypothetical protein
MMASRRFVIPLVVLAFSLFTVASASAAVTNQTLSLDTHSAGPSGSGGAVSTDDVLQAGKLYVITVSGTYSKWTADSWTSSCGSPDPQPATPSPGVTNGPVGLDAETVFATKHSPGETCLTLPLHSNGMLMRVAQGSFQHLEPYTGQATSPASDHTYRYAVTGSGISASFKIADRPVDDDYGVLGVQVRTAQASDCAAAYAAWGFSSQADCEAFFAEHKNDVPPGNTIVNQPGNPKVGGNFVISRRPVRITRAGNIRIHVSCRSVVTCRGKLGLRTIHRLVQGTGKGRKLAFGKGLTFSIPPKTRNVVLVYKLTKANRQLTNRLGHVFVRALARVSLGDPPFKFNAKSRFNIKHQAHAKKQA